MTWYADLSPCNYFPGMAGSALRAIGWLDAEHPYETGPTPREVYERLVILFRDPWQPMLAAGVHECTLCQFAGEAHGATTLWVPGASVIYVCPQLITHYMNAHHYQPPAEFCTAVLACPDTRSMAYKKALFEHGGTGEGS